MSHSRVLGRVWQSAITLSIPSATDPVCCYRKPSIGQIIYSFDLIDIISTALSGLNLNPCSTLQGRVRDIKGANMASKIWSRRRSLRLSALGTHSELWLRAHAQSSTQALEISNHQYSRHRTDVPLDLSWYSPKCHRCSSLF